MKWLHKKDDNRNIVKTYLDRVRIESKIMKFNERYYKKVHEMNAFKEKIYEKLQEDSIRNKILAGELDSDDCDDKGVYEFLTLLKRNNFYGHIPFKLISNNE